MPAALAATTCDAFNTFYSDITTYTAHDTARLIPDAQAVQKAALATGQYVSQADALVAYVSAADFPQNGNVLGQLIQDLYNTCP